MRGMRNLAIVGMLLIAPIVAAAAPNAEAVVSKELDGLGEALQGCRGSEPLAGMRLRVAVVVYEDGTWGVASGPWMAAVPAGSEQNAEAMRGFVETALRVRLAPVLPRPGRAPLVIAKVVTVPGMEERLRKAVEQVVEGARLGAGRCIAPFLVVGRPVTVRVRVTVENDGKLRVARVDRDAAEVASRWYGCVEQGIAQAHVAPPPSGAGRTIEKDLTVEKRRAPGPAPSGYRRRSKPRCTV